MSVDKEQKLAVALEQELQRESIEQEDRIVLLRAAVCYLMRRSNLTEFSIAEAEFEKCLGVPIGVHTTQNPDGTFVAHYDQKPFDMQGNPSKG